MNGRLVEFLYSDKEVVAEENGENTIRYVRGLGIISSDSEEARTYYHYVSDEHGSTTFILNGEKDEAQDRILNRYSYDAFGNIISGTEKVTNRFCYNGEQYDQLTGQYYLRARYYNPVIGRFTQEDTYYGDGLNLYAYCADNPIKYADPSGHNICSTQKDLYHKYLNDPELDVPEGTDRKHAAYRKMREELGKTSDSKYRESGTVPERNVSKGGADFYAAPGGVIYSADDYAKALGGAEGKTSLYHYTTEEGMNSIVSSGNLNPSIKTLTTKDARMGSGQYLTDIIPGFMSNGKLSYQLYDVPWNAKKVVNYVEVDTTGLNLLKGRDGVYYVPNSGPLDIENRILNYGKVGQ